MVTTTISVAERCAAAKQASRTLATLSSEVKDAALKAIAGAVQERSEEILEANARDLESAREGDFAPAFLDKLTLNRSRVNGMVAGLHEIRALPDPVGEVIDGWRLPNRLDVRKVRVPLGAIAVVYEARPNVAIVAEAQCL